MIEVVIAGAGTMGRMHALAYASMDDVRLAGVIDQDGERAGRLAAETGAAAYSSMQQALDARPGVSVIDVCLPTPLHHDYVLQAAAYGKHVICEKPLVGNLKEAENIVNICNNAGVALFVGHVVRFFPEYTEAKKRIDNGDVGKVGMARLSRIGPFPKGSGNWYADKEKSGGVLLDLVIHDFDFLRWCFGEVERVYAKTVALQEGDQADYALVSLRFCSGVIAHVEGSWSHDKFSTKFEIAGDGGLVHHDSTASSPLRLYQRGAGADGPGVAVPLSPLRASPYERELAHFMDCIRTGKTPIVTAVDACRALEISLAAIESAKTGKPVQLARQPILSEGGE